MNLLKPKEEEACLRDECKSPHLNERWKEAIRMSHVDGKGCYCDKEERRTVLVLVRAAGDVIVLAVTFVAHH